MTTPAPSSRPSNAPAAAGHAGGTSADTLHPPFTSRTYLHLAPLSRILSEAIRTRLPAHGLRVLDLGCGAKPYAPLLEGRTRRYVGFDFPGVRTADVYGAADRLPFRSGTFDLVLCTQVLEHVPEPQKTVDEARRVLAGGGLLLLSTHGVWPKHAAADYWRWTDAGLLRLMRGFSCAELFDCGGQYSAFFQLLNLYVEPVPVARRAVYVVSNAFGLALDKIHPARDLVTSYVVVATV